MTATNRKEKEQQLESATEFQESFIDLDGTVKTLIKATPIRNVEIVQRDPMERWLNKVHCGDNVELMNQLPSESVGIRKQSSFHYEKTYKRATLSTRFCR